MTTDPWIGQQLGVYQIIEMIGCGGMGTVYRALHPALERYAAIKFLRTDRAGDPSLDERFLHEARAIARLRHPHIVQLYDFGAYDAGYYMILEFVEGESLHERLKRLRVAGECLPHEQARHIVDQVADALVHVHRQGMVHRDIKPSNILLNAEGDAILADFGIACLLVEEGQMAIGAVIGTPAYIAPEQARGLPTDHRADLYALAAVLYEMLAGRPPFVADSTASLIIQHIQEPVSPPSQFAPDIPPAVERVLLKALSKSPQDRHQSAAAFRSALQKAWEAGISPAEVAPGADIVIAPSLPPLVETPPSTGNLPHLRANFVGRRPEINDLKQQLTQAPAFIGLAGMGGIGKTALALVAAHELAAEGAFPDGFFWIDGREHTTLGAILAELADLLGLELGQETLSQQRRAVTFHLTGRDALVILDNLETVENEQAVAKFLGGLPCAVLVTGRVRPAGAQVIELRPLPPDTALSLFQLVSKLAPEELDAAATDLCAVDLEGHPLAIEVAGALVAAGLEAAELRGYLGEVPLDVLSETAAGAGRSVVDALQLSYQRLSPLAQTLLARMSIFPAGFDLAALAALSPEHSRLHQVKGLRELLDRSLLIQASRQRYRLHPVTRQFAYALLDDPATYHCRAGAHFMTEAGADSLAAAEQLFLAGEIAQAAALAPAHVDEWINAGRASRASHLLERFEAAGLTREAWLALCEARGDLSALLGQTDQAMVAYQNALDREDSPERLARVKRKIGALIRRQQPAEAIAWLEAALAHLGATESLETARICIYTSAAWFYRGEYEQALNWGQRALEIALRMDEPIEITEAKICLGNVYDVQGFYDRAIVAYEGALFVLQGMEHKRPATKAVVQSNLALLYHNLGDWTREIAYHEQSLHTQERLGDLNRIAITCLNLGHVCTLRGDFDQAEAHLNRCLALWERTGSDYGVAATHVNIGQLHLWRGELPEAKATLARSQASFEALGSDNFMPAIYRLMSEVALAQNQATLAVEHAQRSLALAQKLEARMEEGATRRALGATLAAQGQVEAALEELNRGLDLLTGLGHLYEAARTRYELGRLYLKRAEPGDREQAIAFLRHALETFSRLGAGPDITLAQTALAQAELPNQIATTIE